MTAISPTRQDLQEFAASAGLAPGEARLSGLCANITPRMAAGFAGRLKARQIRSQALALDAADTARRQPRHAVDWEAVAAALRDHAEPGISPAAAAALLEGLQ